MSVNRKVTVPLRRSDVSHPGAKARPLRGSCQLARARLPSVRAALREHGLAMGKLAQPVRVALTGTSVSPGIHEVISVLGKDRTARRLQDALAQIA